MVLVSHAAEFIYMKTRKTAGTTVEMYFERFCVPPGTPTGAEAVRGPLAVPDALRRFGRMATREVEEVCGLRGPQASAELWNLALAWEAGFAEAARSSIHWGSSSARSARSTSSRQRPMVWSLRRNVSTTVTR